MNGYLVDIGLYIAYILLIIGILVALVFPIMYVIKHPKEARISLFGIAALIVVFLIGFLASTDEIVGVFKNSDLSQFQFKIIGGGIIMVYILSIVGIGTLIYSEVVNYFK